MKIMLNPIDHTSTLASHYDQEAKYYDAFNEVHSAQTNQAIEQILQCHKVKTALDLTCGTGSQVFWLVKQGYEVVGIDINSKMLEIAQYKAEQQNLLLRIEQDDMRTAKIG
jgi:ubiquinone/menaquinone biosynthesis C-methylase UbiE